MKSIILMTGTTGAGKTTHSRLLSEKTGIHYISSGDIARAMMDPETSELFHRGQLSPHEDKIRAEIFRQIIECGDVHVLDGFPRKREQFEWFTQAISASVFTVRLSWSEKVLVNRWTERHRNEHDTLKAYALRHELYETETAPLFNPNIVVGGKTEQSIFEMNKIIREGVHYWLKKVAPGFKTKDSATQQLIDSFIVDHHISRWYAGQATTHVTLPEEVEKRLWQIAESVR